MNSLTKREKVLLVILGVVAFVVVAYFLLLTPALRNIADQRALLDDKHTELNNMNLTISRAKSFEEVHERNLDIISTAQRELLPVMRSEELERKMTDMLINCQLYPTSVSVDISPIRRKDDGAIQDYDKLPSRQKNSQTSDMFRFYTVSLNCYGDWNAFATLINTVHGTPGVAIVDYNYSQNLSFANLTSMIAPELLENEEGELDTTLLSDTTARYATIDMTLEVYVFDESSFHKGI
ncbi:type II secretion system protein GspM [Eubacteriales bacterium OttesenSCG-928-K08]|nr:type II secretion system protein GspM [Eubacteriales bacterium OttesenSCG-928-K08]